MRELRMADSGVEVSIAKSFFERGRNTPMISDPDFQRIISALDPTKNPTPQDVKQMVAMLSGDVQGMVEAGVDVHIANNLLERQYPLADHKQIRQVIGTLGVIRQTLRMTYKDQTSFDMALCKELKIAAARVFANMRSGRGEPNSQYLYTALVGEAKVRSGEILRKDIKDMTYEEQRQYMRDVMEKIEKTSTPELSYLSVNRAAIDKLMTEDGLSETLKQELRARVFLNDCYALFSSAEGRVKFPDLNKNMFPPGTMATLDMAAREAVGKKRELTGEELKVLLGPEFGLDGKCLRTHGMNGMRVDEAWNQLQIASSDKYMEIVKEACTNLGISAGEQNSLLDPASFSTTVDNDPWLGAKASVNFTTDTDQKRKDIVRRHIALKIKGQDPESALRLAERLRLVLSEDSVANRNVQAGTDQIAEMIGFFPKVFADFKNGKKRSVVVPVVLEGVFALTTSYARYKAMDKNPDMLNPALPLHASDLDYEVNPGDMVAFYGREITTAKKVLDDLMALTPEKSKYATMADMSFARDCDRVDKINKIARGLLCRDPRILEQMSLDLRLHMKTLTNKNDKAAVEQLLGVIKKITDRYKDKKQEPMRLRELSVASDLAGLGYQGYNTETLNMIKNAVYPPPMFFGRRAADPFLTSDEWLRASSSSWHKFIFGGSRL